jgi:pimeloyl-ACP methyl ester carboxylesterase
MKRGVAWLVAALLAVVLLAGCDMSALLRSDSEAAPRASKISNVVSTDDYTAELVEGETGPGALYALYKPTKPAWNGSLVMYAHGYVAPGSGIDLPEASDDPYASEGYLFGQMQAYFLSHGYGLAYSSYSENGWAVKDGITRTRQLKGIYTSRFGKPAHTYLIGASMGGAIVAAIAEKNPELADGVIAISGPVAGPIYQFGYLLNARVVFDFFFPGVVDPNGDAYHVTPQASLDGVGGALLANPLGAGMMAAIDQAPMPYANGDELGLMIGTALWFSVVGTNDVLERTHGHIPVGNADVVYTSSVVPDGVLAALNAQVDRFTATPDAANYLEHWYVPTGKLRVPMVTLHNLRDPAVPSSHEAAFHAIVDAAGKSSLLTQIDPNTLLVPFGHVAVMPWEIENAFDVLLDLIASTGK